MKEDGPIFSSVDSVGWFVVRILLLLLLVLLVLMLVLFDEDEVVFDEVWICLLDLGIFFLFCLTCLSLERKRLNCFRNYY